MLWDCPQQTGLQGHPTDESSFSLIGFRFLLVSSLFSESLTYSFIEQSQDSCSSSGAARDEVSWLLLGRSPR